MGILALDHVQLAMPAGREDEARRFYGDSLALNECPKPLNLQSCEGVWFETANSTVKIHLGDDAALVSDCYFFTIAL